MKTAEKYNILIVDDSKINRALLKGIFKDTYTVTEAENGRVAIELLEQNPDIAVVVLDLNMPELDGFGVMEYMQADERFSRIPVVVITSNDEEENQVKALDCGAVDIMAKPFSSQVVLHRIKNIVVRSEADRIAEQNRMFQLQLKQQEEFLKQSQIDVKTGLHTGAAFCRKASELLDENPDVKYVLLRMDLDRFKVYNDFFGSGEGDTLLAAIAKVVESFGFLCGRMDADHFVMCVPHDEFSIEDISKRVSGMLEDYNRQFNFVVRFGIYISEKHDVEVSLMCDRALLALKSIKGSYDSSYAYYADSMRSSLIEEQRLVSEMRGALKTGQFKVVLQPQYDYANEKLHGAEVLVRWFHPEDGQISPGKFIPMFEKNGFIRKLDGFVWEEACRLMRKWLDMGLKIVPLSVNVSRYDIYDENLCDTFLDLISKYNLSPSMLRVEITESAYMDNSQQLLAVVDTLQKNGFVVEMDDFGSGYSSLNSLKEVPVDRLKLDMKFLDMGMSTERGGKILSAIVRMAHWIDLPVIAEGVETKQQADYLKSIGCNVMQGYYFAKPMPVAEFEALLTAGDGAFEEVIKKHDNDSVGDFLDAQRMESMLFSNYVGAAAIVELNGRNIETICANDRFFEELGLGRSDSNTEFSSVWSEIVPEYYGKLLVTMNEAALKKKNSLCNICFKADKDSEQMWVCARVKHIGKNDSNNIFFVSVENITKQTRMSISNFRLNKKLMMIMNSVPVGIIEFNISDKVIATYYNDMAVKMAGYERQDYLKKVGKDPFAIVHPDDADGLREAIIGFARKKSPTTVLYHTYRQCRNDGTTQTVRLACQIISTNEDSVSAVAVIAFAE